jgi:hypothetical protein
VYRLDRLALRKHYEMGRINSVVEESLVSSRTRPLLD